MIDFMEGLFFQTGTGDRNSSGLSISRHDFGNRMHSVENGSFSSKGNQRVQQPYRSCISDIQGRFGDISLAEEPLEDFAFHAPLAKDLSVTPTSRGSASSNGEFRNVFGRSESLLPSQCSISDRSSSQPNGLFNRSYSLDTQSDSFYPPSRVFLTDSLYPSAFEYRGFPDVEGFYPDPMFDSGDGRFGYSSGFAPFSSGYRLGVSADISPSLDQPVPEKDDSISPLSSTEGSVMVNGQSDDVKLESLTCVNQCIEFHLGEVVSSRVPEIVSSRVFDVASSRVFDVASSRYPDVDSSRVPDVSSQFPDVSSQFPDVTSSQFPDVTSSQLPTKLNPSQSPTKLHPSQAPTNTQPFERFEYHPETSKNKKPLNKKRKGPRTDNEDVDIDKVKRGEETRTAVMVRNLPNRFTKDSICRVLDSVVPHAYTIINTPLDPKTKRNLGYTFVNFHNIETLIKAYEKLQGKTWPNSESLKKIRFCYAKIQVDSMCS